MYGKLEMIKKGSTNPGIWLEVLGKTTKHTRIMYLQNTCRSIADEIDFLFKKSSDSNSTLA